MHPASTALLILGYALAIPIGLKLATIVYSRQRLAFSGHQVGMLLAGCGWLLRGTSSILVAHIIWLVGTRIWYELAAP